MHRAARTLALAAAVWFAAGTAAQARFLQTDPVGYKDSPNLYQYALNDPLNYVDPNGRDVVALHDRIGPGVDHQAFMVGSDRSGRWEYRSLDGAQRDPGSLIPSARGPADYDRGTFGSMAEAFSSGQLSRYERAFVLETTPAQDAAVLGAAADFQAANPTYDVMGCNCGDYTQQSISAVDPNFPVTVNPAATVPYMQNPASAWTAVPGKEPPPPPRENYLRDENGNRILR